MSIIDVSNPFYGDYRYTLLFAESLETRPNASRRYRREEDHTGCRAEAAHRSKQTSFQVAQGTGS